MKLYTGVNTATERG